MQQQMHAEQAIRDREHEIRKRIRRPRPERQAPARSVRRVVGRSMISIGSRLAAEPQTSRSHTASALPLARAR